MAATTDCLGNGNSNNSKTIETLKLYQKTLLNLQIIGNIREQDRVSSAYGHLNVPRPSKLTCLFRAFQGESRSQNVQDIEAVLSDAFSLLKIYCPTARTGDDNLENKQRVVHLTDALGATKIGLNNLAITYADDVLTKSKINLLILSIDDQLALIQQNNPNNK